MAYNNALTDMKNNPGVVEWNGAAPMETGAPLPSIALRADGLYLAYAVSGQDQKFAVVRFRGVLQHTFGYPNDEALQQHPLYEAGLKFYAFNEVSDSPLVADIARRNERVFPGSSLRITRRSHWVVTFHDETLEVVGDDIEFLGVVSANSAAAAIDTHVVQQAHAGTCETHAPAWTALAPDMSEFRIYSGAMLVGTSNLEYGDPPMGVAFGRFFPTAAYASIQSECASNHDDQTNLHLSVVAPSGETIPCAGMGILDRCGDIEVNVLGISNPPYVELFPQHVARYEAALK